MCKHKIVSNIIFNSRDRDNKSDPTNNCTSSFRGITEYVGWRVKSVSIPKSWYNIALDIKTPLSERLRLPPGFIDSEFEILGNAAMYWSDTIGGPARFEIPPGNYSISDLVIFFNNTTECGWNSLVLTTYNSLTNTITFENINALETVLFEFFFYNPILTEMLGMDGEVFNRVIEPGETLTGTCVNMNRTDQVQVACSNIHYRETIMISETGENIIAIVYDDQEFGGILHYDETNIESYKLNYFINNISFRLLDQRGIDLNLNGCNWGIEILTYQSK